MPHPAANARASWAMLSHWLDARDLLVRPWPRANRTASPLATSSPACDAGSLTTSASFQGNRKTLPPTRSAVVPNIFFSLIAGSLSLCSTWRCCWQKRAAAFSPAVWGAGSAFGMPLEPVQDGALGLVELAADRGHHHLNHESLRAELADRLDPGGA